MNQASTDEILRLHDAGKSVSEICDLTVATALRVYKVLRAHRSGSRKPKGGTLLETEMNSSGNYALGYDEAEALRLERQAAFLEDLTEDVLRRAGVAPGMQVLD